MRIDLDRIKAKIMKTKKWSDTRATDAEREYRRFLRLIAENPGQAIVPWSQDLDEFWHAHIQDTRAYAADCDRIFGRFIHHDPHIEQDPDRYHEAWNRTRALYAEAFIPAPKKREEDHGSFWGDLTEALGEFIQGVADAFGNIGCGSGHSCSSDGGGHGCTSGCSSGCSGCSGGCGGGCGGS